MSLSILEAPARRLAPPSPAEVATAARILRAELALPAAARLAGFALRQPSQEALAARRPGDPVDRDVVVTVDAPGLGATCEAVVAVDDGFVRSFRRRTGIEPSHG